jgi:hypothetical protein
MLYSRKQMAIASQSLAWIGDAALILLVARAFPSRLIRVYGYFYMYLASIMCQNIFIRISGGFASGPNQFAFERWALEFGTAVIGFGLIWEVYRQALAPYAGVRVMTRFVILTVFAAMLVKAYVALKGSSIKRLMPTTLQIEANLRVVQVILLIALLSLIFYYGIQLGRNLRYLLIGYAGYIGADLLTVALVANHFTIGGGVQMSRSLLIQFEYCVTLMIWCVGMWSCYREPVVITELQADYEHLSRQTARAVGRIRDHITGGWRK